MRWFRFYEDAVNDPAIQCLSAEHFKIWVNLLCLTSKNNGKLPPDLSNIAFYIRETEQAMLTAIEALLAEGFLVRGDDGVVALSNWRSHQASQRPDAAEWRSIRERIFERDGYTCTYCGAHGVELQCDHVLPVAAGGGHDDSNLVTSCGPCNQAKSSKIVSVEEWRAIRGGAV